MEANRHGESSRRNRGHSEQQRSDAGSEQCFYPGGAAELVLDGKQERDGNLRNPQLKEPMQPA